MAAKSAPAGKNTPTARSGERVVYAESQRVPLIWWALATGVVAIIAWQAQMGRDVLWSYVALAIAGTAVIWGLVSLSRTTVRVVEKADGSRWLFVGEVNIPNELIGRTLVIPPTAKQAAMGRQLDPAAYVSHKPWLPAMAMLVVDDPHDPTPYWLISCKDPGELLNALGRPSTDS